MQAVILAAGMGKRLKDLTKNNTKCMIEVNGVKLIEKALKVLDRKNLERIILVVGYQALNLINFINSLDLKTEIKFIENKIFDKTNNIYSLSLAKDDLISDDTLILESDLIFDEDVIDTLLDDERETLALVDKFEGWMDGTCVVINENDRISEFIPGKYIKFDNQDKYFKTVNIYKFSRGFSRNIYVPFLEAYQTAVGNNEYYESVIKLIAMLENCEIQVKRLEGQRWYEIDDIADLDVANSIFSEKKEKYHALMQRYGGYWRYPKIIDFCYLVNPFYPPKKMIEEMTSNFETLLTQYPSGREIINLTAGKDYNIDKDNITVGNGASELIKILLENFTGKTGFITPTFQEYIHRYPVSESVYMNASNKDFSYSAEDIISYFSQNKVNNLIIINPDNPSGNYIDKADIIKLIEWCKNENIKLVIDESFVDFVDNGQTLDELTLISDSYLNMYREGLYVIKSISKSSGVPGARLGVIASADSEMMNKIKRELPIWNINSFGEFYLQIAEKYKNDYTAAIDRFKDERKFLYNSLVDFRGLYPISSQANYIMCEIINGVKSETLCAYLLDKNILIKDLTPKINNNKEYIRIAVKNREDNECLINTLKQSQLLN